MSREEMRDRKGNPKGKKPMRLEYRTTSVPSKKQFEYWHDVVCQRFVLADSVQKNINSFEATLISEPFGRLEISQMNAPSHSWSRRHRHIHTDDEEHYLLSIIESGTGVLTQYGRTAVQRAGNVALYDTSLPFEYALSGELKLIKIPHQYFEARLPNARDLLVKNLAKETPLASLLRHTIRTALELHLDENEYRIVGERVANSIIDLLLALVDLWREGQNMDGFCSSRLEKVKAFAIANLGNHELNTQSLADAGGVSTRTLNRLFAAFGTTPMRWLHRERLRFGKSCLEDRSVKSVTEVAFMVGFNDLSHFSRSFKRYFGVSPEQVIGKR